MGSKGKIVLGSRENYFQGFGEIISLFPGIKGAQDSFIISRDQESTGPLGASLLIVTPIVGFCNCSMLCCKLLCVHFSFTIISMGKRDLVALFVFLVSRDCCVALPRDATGLSAVGDCGVS